MGRCARFFPIGPAALLVALIGLAGCASAPPPITTASMPGITHSPYVGAKP